MSASAFLFSPACRNVARTAQAGTKIQVLKWGHMNTKRAVCASALAFLASLVQAQIINPSQNLVITGHSQVQFAPWPAVGIPLTDIRGHDSYTCAMLKTLLPYDVPAGTNAVALVESTNDVLQGTSPEDGVSCVEDEITWLEANRPGIRIVVANVAPFGEGNCYGDFREQIAEYNALYAGLPGEYGITLADISSVITQPDGWAILSYMDGLCLIHQGQFQQLNDGWTFFMDQIIAAIQSH